MSGPFVRLAAVLAAAAAGLAYCGARLDGPDWPLARAVFREQARSAALERRDERARRCAEAEAAVTAELVAGRVGLDEAAGQFRDIQGAMADDGEDALLGPWRKPEDERGTYRCVLSWAESALRDDPVRAAEVLPRLEQEYRQHFHEGPWDFGEPSPPLACEAPDF